MSQKDAFAFEKYIVGLPKPGEFPDEAIKVYKESLAEGVPTAFADHPEKGKAVICTAGQGPMVLWREGEGAHACTDSQAQEGQGEEEPQEAQGK